MKSRYITKNCAIQAAPLHLVRGLFRRFGHLTACAYNVLGEFHDPPLQPAPLCDSIVSRTRGNYFLRRFAKHK